MSTRIVPLEWMPGSLAERIIIHWTAGSYTPSALDRRHYHILIDGDGLADRGRYPISANDSTSDADGYAAHTRGLNTRSIGVALCAMAGAIDSPLSLGRYPITLAQWGALADVCADLCQRYDIDPHPETLLTHAEVEPKLGVKQRGKWDIRVTPRDTPPQLRPAAYVGDQIRAMVRERLVLAAPALDPAPASGTVESGTTRAVQMANRATLVIALPDGAAPALHLNPFARELTITTFLD